MTFIGTTRISGVPERAAWECSDCRVAARPFLFQHLADDFRGQAGGLVEAACSSNSSDTATLVMPKKAPSIAAPPCPSRGR